MQDIGLAVELCQDWGKKCLSVYNGSLMLYLR